MPALELMDRNQYALLWPKTGNSNYGEMMRGSVVELKPSDGTGVRWVWKKSQVMGADGNAKSIDATIITDRIVAEGSLMWLGTLSDFNGTDSVDPELDLVQVLAMNRIEDIKGRNTRYEMYAAYYRSTQPS